jgi:hypothetical protein
MYADGIGHISELTNLHDEAESARRRYEDRFERQVWWRGVSRWNGRGNKNHQLSYMTAVAAAVTHPSMTADEQVQMASGCSCLLLQGAQVSMYDQPGLDAIRKETGILSAKLVRDIFGNPFRPVTFDADWRTSTVVALAKQMYESRDFSAMPILADALQDAGCENDDILKHCRDAKGVHVRGCWVVDLVLGKS